MLKSIVLAFAAWFSTAAFAQHARHNMVVHGAVEVFASHIVYKVPHNYQVIIRVRFSKQAQAAYLAARAEHPNDTFIFLLDAVHIADLAAQERISGVLFRRDVNDARVDIATNVVLERSQYDVVYSEELPLSLAAER